MDISDRVRVFDVVGNVRPDIIVHAAAETDVDRCESEREIAWKVNVDGTKNLAEAALCVGAKIVYVSTDYVFDGEKGLYREDDKMNPINYYGATKLEGERFTQQTTKEHAIVRTSVLYGWHPSKKNFVSWVLDSLRKGQTTMVVDDHWNSPTLADNLAETILRIVENDAHGVYHVAGKERIDRFRFAVKIAEHFNLEKSLLKPIQMRDLKAWVARRPRDSSLQVEKAERDLGVKLLDVDQGLKLMRETAN